MTRKIVLSLILLVALMCTVAFAEGTPSPTTVPTNDIASVDMNITNNIPWWIWTVLVAIGSLLLALKQYIKDRKSRKSKN